MQNTLIALAVVVLLAGGGYYFYSMNDAAVTDTTQGAAVEVQESIAEGAVVAGTYTVNVSESTVGWSAKKPLIEGYVNSGTIGITEGTISVTDSSATGSFTIDMNTIDVGLTAKKPGKEGALEGHLKSDDFFDVEKFPTASFAIKNVALSSEPLTYSVTGDLTMKGVTNELTFPAKIYLNDSGKLVADATFEFDRTKWGITYGSDSFFDDLADRAISDMVEMRLMLVADKS